MGVKLKMKLDEPALRQAIGRRVATGRKAAAVVVKEAAKGILREAIKITPPASGGPTGRKGTEAKKQGEMKISSDLGRVFEPVALKGKRKEMHPDVAGIYRGLRRSGGNRWAVKRPAQGHMYVDAKKLERLYADLIKEVGRLLSAFAPAATKLGVSLPAWARRHGAGRGGRLVMRVANTDKPSITVIANMPNARMAADVQRRVDWAVAQQVRKYDRQWQSYLKKQQQRESRRAA
jgi:hypothetical protein